MITRRNWFNPAREDTEVSFSEPMNNTSENASKMAVKTTVQKQNKNNPFLKKT